MTSVPSASDIQVGVRSAASTGSVCMGGPCHTPARRARCVPAARSRRVVRRGRRAAGGARRCRRDRATAIRRRRGRDADPGGGEPGGRSVEVDRERDRVQRAAPARDHSCHVARRVVRCDSRTVRSPMSKSAIVSGPSLATGRGSAPNTSSNSAATGSRSTTTPVTCATRVTGTSPSPPPSGRAAVARVAGEAVVGELEHEPERVARVHEEVTPLDVHAGDADAGLHQVVLRRPHVGHLPRQRLHAGAVPGQPAPDEALGIGRRQREHRHVAHPHDAHVAAVELVVHVVDHHPGTEHAAPLLDGAGAVEHREGDAVAVAGIAVAAGSWGHRRSLAEGRNSDPPVS